MKILMCAWRDLAHPRRGGAEVYTHEVLRRWAADGHEVTLRCAAVAGRPRDEHVDGYRVVRGGSRFSVYRDAARWYRSSDATFDLVIDQINTRPFQCGRWGADVPHVALAHQVAREVWFAELPLPAALLGRFVLEPRWLAEYRYTPTLTISESSRASLEHYGLQQVSVIPTGCGVVPSISPSPSRETTPTLAFIGRLARNKRPDEAIAAFEIVRRSAPEARLWVIGTGPMEAALRRRAPDGVEFFGFVDQERKFELLARAHALITTSVREGFGLVVDEAAAVGTPTIGYDIAGLRDSVRASGGTLVDPDPHSLARAICEELPALTAADADRRPLARGTRSWDIVADTLLATALRALELGSGPTPTVPTRQQAPDRSAA